MPADYLAFGGASLDPSSRYASTASLSYQGSWSPREKPLMPSGKIHSGFNTGNNVSLNAGIDLSLKLSNDSTHVVSFPRPPFANSGPLSPYQSLPPHSPRFHATDTGYGERILPAETGDQQATLFVVGSKAFEHRTRMIRAIDDRFRSRDGREFHSIRYI